MQTDWSLIRELVAASIDACEAAEALQLSESDRMRAAGEDGVSVFDVWTSAWTYPENLTLQVIRTRHELGEDLPYVPESARVLENVGRLCASLVAATHLDDAPSGDSQAIRPSIEELATWYRETMTRRLAAASG